MRVEERAVRESVDHLFRHQAGRMVATLTRIFGLRHLDAVEDVVQDALVKALRTWPYQGMPDNPAAWLLRVARNRMLDRLRRAGTRRDKEPLVGRELEIRAAPSSAIGARFAGELPDDPLRMIFACCHPQVPPEAQVALVLKTVGGFSVAEIARAFLVSEPTVAQRLVRAKRRLRQRQVKLEVPEPAALEARLDPVLEALYLMFNEGYAAGAGADLIRADLCFEAIRLLELLAANPVTDTPRVRALAALTSFQASRLATRLDAAGELLLLAEQDRSRWDRRLIAAGLEHLGRSARGDELSTYHLEAEIASCHALAKSWEETDWTRILAAYEELAARRPSPIVALNRAVAMAQVDGPEVALQALAPLAGESSLETYYPYWATLGEMLRRAGRLEESRRAFRRALELEASAPVRRLLLKRANRALPDAVTARGRLGPQPLHGRSRKK